MKKIKLLFAVLLSFLCFPALFAFSGCTDKDVYDLEYDCYWNFNYCILRGNFEYKNSRNFTGNDYSKITYTLYIYDCKELIAKEKITSEYDSGYNFTKNLGTDVSNTSNIEVKIRNIIVEESGKKHDYTPYAIGFGVTAAVLLAGAITVFILDKKGILTKRK